MSAHTHPDASVLVSACPACIERVQFDQVEAWWREAPTRKVTFRIRSRYRTVCELTLQLKVPVDASEPELRERYAGEIARFYGPGAIDNTTHLVVGPIVETPSPAVVDVPSLFEALS